jgi:hypothetical protein
MSWAAVLQNIGWNAFAIISNTQLELPISVSKIGFDFPGMSVPESIA